VRNFESRRFPIASQRGIGNSAVAQLEARYRSASRSEQCAPGEKKEISPLATRLRSGIAAGQMTCTLLFTNDGKCTCTTLSLTNDGKCVSIFSWCRRFSPAGSQLEARSATESVRLQNRNRLFHLCLRGIFESPISRKAFLQRLKNREVHDPAEERRFKNFLDKIFSIKILIFPCTFHFSDYNYG